MNALPLDRPATDEDFVEADYLLANPDVAAAVKQGSMKSGWHHFQNYGKFENRIQRLTSEAFGVMKARKLERIRPLLNCEMQHNATKSYFDFLTADLRKSGGIIDTDNVSAHPYDPLAMELIQRHSNGLVLDVGAGRRPVYFEHVVNYEIVPYDSTDVMGIGEALPFTDDSFDAVLSIAVLEHVRDPFRCAAEISRILKPGGEVYIVVPFNQPLHGYPNHYYNMTHMGLKNLFERYLTIKKQAVLDSTLPIWNLAWYLQSWADGLTDKTRSEFLAMSVGDLAGNPLDYLSRPFVRELSEEKNFELAACTALWAQKPVPQGQ